MYTLILVYLAVPEEYADLQEEADKLVEELGLRITSGVIITWRPKEELVRRLDKLKDYIIRKLEEGIDPLELVYSVIELDEEKYKNVRPLVVKKLEMLCNSLQKRIENLLERVRSCTGREVRKYRQELQELEESFKKVAEFHKVFDVRHSAFDRVNKLMAELRAEFYRRLK